MKKLFKFIAEHPVYILLIFICVAFLPSAVVAEPQSRSKLIVRALGIDKNESGYEVSVIAFTPKATEFFTENYKIIEGKGNSLYEAISNISIESGRDVALAHAGIIFVGNGVCENGLVETMDYLVRDYSLGNDTFVAYVPSSVKDMIKSAKNLIQDSGVKLGDIAQFDEDKIILQKSDIESIYSSAYSKSKCCFINVMELSQEQGIETQNSQAQQSSQNAQQQSNLKKILNYGKALVVKEGKSELLLDKEEVNSIKFLKNFSESGILRINDFSDENFKNANLSLSTESNNVKYNFKFVDKKPVVEIFITTKLHISEVNQKQLSKNIFVGKQRLSSEKLIEEVNDKIKEQTSKILNKLTEKNLDFLSLYEKFDARFHKEFQNYLSSLENKDDYIKTIDVKIKVNALIN